MKPRSQPAVAGPVIFFGLIIYTMFAPSIDLTDYANPADTMNLAEITTPQDDVRVRDIFADFAPVRPVPVAPARLARAPLPDQAGFDGTVLVTQQSASPVRFFATPEAFRIAAPSLPPEDSARPMPPLPLAPLARSVTPDMPATAQPRAYQPGVHDWVRVTGNAVNLRSAPSRTAEVERQFDSGAIALKVAESGVWSRLTFLTRDPPVSGWMATQFLRPLDSAPDGAAQP